MNVRIWILFAQNFHFEKKCTKEDVKVKYHCLRISISYMKHFDMPFRLMYLKHTIKLQDECISKSNKRCANLNLIWNLICFMRSVLSSYSSKWNFLFTKYAITLIGIWLFLQIIFYSSLGREWSYAISINYLKWKFLLTLMMSIDDCKPTYELSPSDLEI